MEIKVRELKLERREAALKGTETFDSGQMGTRGVSIDNMSPEEKIAFGLRKMK